MLQKVFNTALLTGLCSFLLLLQASCGPKEENVAFPENILKEPEFTALLTDYALAESAGSMNVKSIPGPLMDSVYAFNPLAEHKVRQSQYDSTLAFYIRHPHLYKKVYENVLINLAHLQTARDSLKAAQGSK